MYVPYNVYNVRDWKLQRLLHMYVCMYNTFGNSMFFRSSSLYSLGSLIGKPAHPRAFQNHIDLSNVYICTCMNDHYPFYPTISQCQWYQQVIGRVDPNQSESAPSQAIMIMIIPIHQMPQVSNSLSLAELSSGSRCRIPKGCTYACNGAYILLGS